MGDISIDVQQALELERKEVRMRLARIILDAEAYYEEAVLNRGGAAQMAARDEVVHYKYAFAVATQTAVHGIEFNKLLTEAKASLENEHV